MGPKPTQETSFGQASVSKGGFSIPVADETPAPTMVPPPRPQRNAFQLQREDGGRRNTSSNTDMMELKGFNIPMDTGASGAASVQQSGFNIPLANESATDDESGSGTISHGGFAIPLG